MQAIKWTSEELELLKATSCIKSLPAHKIIFNEDSPAEYIYYIQSGHIKYYHNTAAGKEVIVSIYGGGEIIGLTAVLHGENCDIFAKAMENCVIWQMSRESFIKLIEENTGISIKLIRILCSYVRNYEYRLEELLATSTEAKVASLLCHLAENKFEAGNKCYIDYRITHQEMANMIGACRQTVTEILGRFQEKGLIRTHKRNAIEISSWDEIRHINSLY
ncbi:Crp/Fnr family transcriptional regulator [Pectinatus frisingensis]|jgi:CRP/FNR family transcriptional regulator|uniref:Crp/Fnr family transcriptional regulator n=1 Tax=Pectinatus frisingensis TaxID=865 RepID=UPI0015F5E94E|nr:Crp/Fnr family transcriptional regulator [Pectinatus frisingensis]